MSQTTELPSRPENVDGRTHPVYEGLAAVLRRQDIHVASMRPTNYLRSLFHVMSGVVALACIQHVLSPSGLVWVSLAFAGFAWTAEICRRLSPAINLRLMAFFGPLAHAHEYHRVNSGTWYATALGLLAVSGNLLAASLAVVVLAVGDPVAALVGRRYGRTTIRANRSLEGSLAFVAAAALAGLAVLRIYYPALGLEASLSLALVGALAGMLAELYSRRVDDNFTIPVTVGIAVSVMAPWLS